MTNIVKLPPEFISMNDVPVPVATIKRERMEEILRDTIKDDRQHHERMAVAHEWIRSSLGLNEDAPYRFDYYAQEIESLKADRQQRGGAIAWESKTPVFRKFVTDITYQRFSTETKRWYKPYKCPSCEAPQPVAPALDAISSAIGAMELALDSHGKTLLTEPPQEAWKYHNVSQRLRDGVSGLTGLTTPAQEPSDDDLHNLWSRSGGVMRTFARSLLARYGSKS